MTYRDLLAGAVGAGLAVVCALSAPSVRIVADAVAQTQERVAGQPAADNARMLILAIASALASIAVDGERTAVSLNETIDDTRALAERLSAAEKRLAALESKR